MGHCADGQTPGVRNRLAVFWRVEGGVAIGTTALGVGLLTVPSGTPLLGGVPTWLALAILAFGLLLLAIAIARFAWEHLRLGAKLPQEEDPDKRAVRIGVEALPGSRTKVSRSRFGKGLDRGIVNDSGDVDASENEFE